MLFCKSCQNMYYIQLLDDGESLRYSCRTCGDIYDGEMTLEHMLVSKTTVSSGTIEYSNWVNEYTKYDPTLLRVNNIPCLNKECRTNVDGFDTHTREIIVIRYDLANLKYLYLCPECDHVWTPE